MLKLVMKSIPFRYIYLLFLISTTSLTPLIGQHKQEEKACFMCKADLHYHNSESPYHDFSFKKELPFLGGLAGLSAINLLIDAPTPLTEEDILGLDGQSINSFDRYAISKNSDKAQEISDFFLTGVLVLPAIFLSNHHTRKDVIPLVVMTLEVAGLNYALTSITKKVVKRTRPLAYNPVFSLEEKTSESARVSFFSGHTSHTTSLSFLVAKVMTDYHPDARTGVKIGIWTFAASIPALTGYLRIRAGKHFPTDTIVGYLAGGLIGIGIPELHKRNRKTDQKVKIQPLLGVGTASVRVTF